MKRYEVTVESIGIFTGDVSVISKTQYRWRWWARLQCFLVNNCPYTAIFRATCRPILRVVPPSEAASAK